MTTMVQRKPREQAATEIKNGMLSFILQLQLWMNHCGQLSLLTVN